MRAENWKTNAKSYIKFKFISGGAKYRNVPKQRTSKLWPKCSLP
jgi:hypothetical protein